MRLGPAVLPDAELLSSVIEVPWNFLAGSEGRLIPESRGAAQTMDPVEILARAGVRFLEARSDARVVDAQVDTAYGNALADLAVTGRPACRAGLGPFVDAKSVVVAQNANTPRVRSQINESAMQSEAISPRRVSGKR